MTAFKLTRLFWFEESREHEKDRKVETEFSDIFVLQEMNQIYEVC